MSRFARRIFSNKQSEVNETRLQESVRYALTPPSVYWPEASSCADPLCKTNDLAIQNRPIPDAEMLTQPVALTTISNASVYLTGGRHAVLTSDGVLVSAHRVSDKKIRWIPWRLSRHLSGSCLLLGNSAGASCYYHWMLDLLPKLGFLQRAGIDLHSINYFLVREAVTPFQLESFERLGIDKSRIIETAKQPYLTCDEVILVHLEHQVNLTMHQFVPEWINNTFSNSSCTDEKSLDRIKLYIKRPIDVRRAIHNAAEVESLLVSRGFECVEMEGMSIKQQAQLLARADVVVSQHGAALTNLVFAQPGTDVIELFGTHVYPFYFGLANLCKLNYHAILQSVDDYASLVQLETALKKGSDKNVSKTQNEGFSVNLASLDKAITAVLA